MTLKFVKKMEINEVVKPKLIRNKKIENKRTRWKRKYDEEEDNNLVHGEEGRGEGVRVMSEEESSFKNI